MVSTIEIASLIHLFGEEEGTRTQEGREEGDD